MEKVRQRKETRSVTVGNVKLGGNNIIPVQSMTTTKTKDVDATVAQIKALTVAGCDIIRVAVLDEKDAMAIKEIQSQIDIPLVADIHFDYQLALLAIENGSDAVRLNPGNIGNKDKIRQVVEAAKAKKIPIRIGVNGGSLEKHILEKYGEATPVGMVESAMHHVKILEELDFNDIVISLKATDVDLTVKAYELAAKTFTYPLHLGITEAGTDFSGTIKSSIGLGILLNQGIGNTIRVSLSDDPIKEIKVAREILKNLGLIENMPTLVSCPTCGRLEYEMIPLAKRVEKYLENIHHDITVAIMGCPVNGPGEARAADVGIAGGRGQGILFRSGDIVCKVSEADMFDALIAEIEDFVKDM